jgi:hypothetical protein
MTFLDRTRGTGDEPRWFLVERETFGAVGYAHRGALAAHAAFRQVLAAAAENGEPYSPHDRGRRLLVLGPDHERLVPSATDPLPSPDAALRAVLTDDEYARYVTGPVVASLLES